jgi:hypothetical protein
MKTKSLIMMILGFFVAFGAYALQPLMPSPTLGAAPGATQYVGVFNQLANLSVDDPGLTKTDVNVVFYDAKGKCFEYGFPYYNDPIAAGAGGKNGCGAQGSPPKIIKVDIVPVSTAGREPAYLPAPGVAIDPTKTLSFIIIEQKTAPTYDSITGRVKPGTLNARIVTSTK